MKKLAIPAALAVALLAPVAAVEAKGPKSGKRPGASHGPRADHAPAADRGPRAERESRSRRCAKGQRVGFVVEGTLASFDEDSVTLAVVRANRHARRWLEANAPEFSTDGARLSFEGVADADGNGSVGLEDVAPTDRVRVIGKLAKPKRGCTGDERLQVRKVAVEREAPEDDDDSEAAGEPAEQPAA